MVGLDSHGNAGLRDKVDRHYKRLLGFRALTSLFSAAFDLSQRRAYGHGFGGRGARDESDRGDDHQAPQSEPADDEGAGWIQIHCSGEPGVDQ